MHSIELGETVNKGCPHKGYAADQFKTIWYLLIIEYTKCTQEIALEGNLVIYPFE